MGKNKKDIHIWIFIEKMLIITKNYIMVKMKGCKGF